MLLVASLAGLPWISVGGEDASLRDIGDAYSALDGLDVGDGGVFAPPDVSVPDITDPTDLSVPGTTLPDGSSPGGLGPVVTPPGVPGTVDDTYTPPPSGDLEPFHELYAKGLCWAVAVWATLGLVVAAAWVPRAKGGRMTLGFLVAGFVGLIATAVDEQGRAGPRVAGAFVALVCLVAHGAAVAGIFGEDGAPDPARRRVGRRRRPRARARRVHRRHPHRPHAGVALKGRRRGSQPRGVNASTGGATYQALAVQREMSVRWSRGPSRPTIRSSIVATRATSGLKARNTSPCCRTPPKAVERRNTSSSSPSSSSITTRLMCAAG